MGFRFCTFNARKALVRISCVKSCFRRPMSVATGACQRKRRIRLCFSHTLPAFREGSPKKKNRKDSFSRYDVDVVECGF